MTLNVFIGHDEREQSAFDVCEYSMKRRGSVAICGLRHRQMREQGRFWRRWTIDRDGQYFDMEDGKPFSTQFSHTRFLVPDIARDMGINGWALYCDCDFLWLVDPQEIMKFADPQYAVMVCKHEHKPANLSKMDGMVQMRYPRKNWSSLILWNLDHESNRKCDRVMVNEADGGRLHNFAWLHESEIGALPLGWNFLLGHTSPENDWKAIHFTDGGPWIDGWKQNPLLQEADDLWTEEREDMNWRKVMPIVPRRAAQ